MSEPAVDQPVARKPTPPLGSFAIGPRVMDPGRRLPNALLVSVIGRSGTPFENRPAFAYCGQLEASDDETRRVAKARLDAIQALNRDHLVVVLEAGIAGKVAFTIEEQPDGERLSERLAVSGAVAPWRAATWITEIAGALEAVRATVGTHGAVSSLTTWIDAGDRMLLGGIAPVQTTDNDQARLAALAYEFLTGKVWVSPAGAVSGPALKDAVRSHGAGISDLVATAVARGLETDPDLQFASVGEFAHELTGAVSNSAHDIALAAWESISRQDIGLATILAQLLPAYDPASPETALLRHRLNGATVAEQFKASAEPVAELRSLAERIEQQRSVEMPGAGAALSEEDMQRLFGGVSIDQKVNRGNPWVIFIAVVFGMIAIMTILAAIALNQT